MSDPPCSSANLHQYRQFQLVTVMKKSRQNIRGWSKQSCTAVIYSARCINIQPTGWFHPRWVATKRKSTWLTSPVEIQRFTFRQITSPVASCLSFPATKQLASASGLQLLSFSNAWAGKTGVAVMTAVDFLLTAALPFNKFLLRWKCRMLLSHFYIWYTGRGCGSVLVSKLCCVIWSQQIGRHLRPDWIKQNKTTQFDTLL